MMRKNDLKENGLADMAFKVESDHEVQMARAELYKVAKYAIKMHEMLKGVEEREGLEGWVQSKITKAADYISSVKHHMEQQPSDIELAVNVGPTDMEAESVTELKSEFTDEEVRKAIAIAKHPDIKGCN